MSAVGSPSAQLAAAAQQQGARGAAQAASWGGRSRRQRYERTTAAGLRRRERLTRAMATRLFCPPDSVYIGCAASSAGMPKLLSWARCTSSLCCK